MTVPNIHKSFRDFRFSKIHNSTWSVLKKRSGGKEEKTILMTKRKKVHYVKLLLRSLLFCAVLVFYILDRTDVLTYHAIVPIVVWVFFVVEMFLRFFPSGLESMGYQKQFARNYEPTETESTPTNPSWKQTALVTAVWLALNAVVGVLYFTGIIDRGILILIAIAYSVCDIVCILFFCPFQTWFMKNR